MPDQDTLPSHDPTALLSQTHVKILKFAVVAMGVMIFVGLAVIIGRVIYLASSSDDPAPATVNTIVPAGQISLPDGARVSQMTMNGDRLAIYYEAGEKSGLVILDLRTGRQISQFAIGSPSNN
ncbi:MAG: DUF6476 family protein [Hyphomicrobiaceae bacterium]